MLAWGDSQQWGPPLPSLLKGFLGAAGRWGILAARSCLNWGMLGFTEPPPRSITLLSDAGLGKSSLMEYSSGCSLGRGQPVAPSTNVLSLLGLSLTWAELRPG